jgi:hypothetical protein
VNGTLDHKVGRVLPDASVRDESKDLYMRRLAALRISIYLLALE